MAKVLRMVAAAANGLTMRRRKADGSWRYEIVPEEDRPLYVVGLNTPNRCEIIADSLLKRGYRARVTDKVLGSNFVRAFNDIWKA